MLLQEWRSIYIVLIFRRSFGEICILQVFNSLPNDKFLNRSKLKALADNLN